MHTDTYFHTQRMLIRIHRHTFPAPILVLHSIHERLAKLLVTAFQRQYLTPTFFLWTGPRGRAAELPTRPPLSAPGSAPTAPSSAPRNSHPRDGREALDPAGAKAPGHGRGGRGRVELRTGLRPGPTPWEQSLRAGLLRTRRGRRPGQGWRMEGRSVRRPDPSTPRWGPETSTFPGAALRRGRDCRSVGCTGGAPAPPPPPPLPCSPSAHVLGPHLRGGGAKAAPIQQRGRCGGYKVSSRFWGWWASREDRAPPPTRPGGRRGQEEAATLG